MSCNWDVDELKKAAEKIKETSGLFRTGLNGVEYSPELLV